MNAAVLGGELSKYSALKVAVFNIPETFILAKILPLPIGKIKSEVPELIIGPET